MFKCGNFVDTEIVVCVIRIWNNQKGLGGSTRSVLRDKLKSERRKAGVFSLSRNQGDGITVKEKNDFYRIAE